MAMKGLDLKDISRQFEIDDKKAEAFVSSFHNEMSRGLEKRASSLKMLSSFVKRPTGSETGRFLALDLGGTNFRVMAVELSGKRSFKTLAANKYSIPNELMTGKGVDLFDFIASKLGVYLTDNRFPRKERYGLGFTFSFPVEQTAINAGRLIRWTKGFTASGVEGKDVVFLLEEALKREKIDCISVKALANDTVGTLMAKSYEVPECCIGVSLGPGRTPVTPKRRRWTGRSSISSGGILTSSKGLVSIRYWTMPPVIKGRRYLKRRSPGCTWGRYTALSWLISAKR
jgi:hexokinase